MSGRRRTATVWGSLAIVAAALMGQRITAAEQPVHEVQVVASRYAFEPSTIRVIAGERSAGRPIEGRHPWLRDETVPRE